MNIFNPHHCTIYVGSKCNFKCEWCSNQHKDMEQCEWADEALVSEVLNKYPQINGVCLCGFCEPLLSHKIYDLVRAVKMRGKFCGLITNGSLLEDKIGGFVGIYKPDYISVSLNASNPKDHKEITKTETFEKVLKGIIKAVSLGHEVYLSYVVTTKNKTDVPYIIKLANGLNVKKLYLHNLLPHFDDNLNGVSFWDLVLTKEHEYLIDAWKMCFKSDIVDRWPVLLDKEDCKWQCKYMWNSIAVNSNKSISICNSVIPCHKDNGSLEDDLNTSKYCVELRDRFLNKDETLPCSKCFRNWEYK